MQWTGLFVVVIALAVATAYGLLRQSRQGRIKPVLATYPDAGAVRFNAGPPAVAAVDGLRAATARAEAAVQADAGQIGTARSAMHAAAPNAESGQVGAVGPSAKAATPESGAVEPAADVTVGEASSLAGIGVVAGQVTLLQFSSAFCAPCRATRSVLADVAGRVEGVTHLEVDAESHLDVVRALKIWRTPTTFIIDTEGRIVGRAQGIPHRGQVLAAVTPLLSNHPTALQGQS
jgi:thiol-disulfide isomerase/thioredoxin